MCMTQESTTEFPLQKQSHHSLLDLVSVHLLPASMKAEGFGRMLLHLQDRLDLLQWQLAVAVLVAAGPVLLPGLLVAKQPRTRGSLPSH